MTDALFRSELRRTLPLIVRGEGAHVFDAEGRRYLDATSGGVMVANIGHGVAEIGEAMARQAKHLAFAFHAHVDNPRAVELARRIVALAPPGISDVFFVNTGSEATETAVKLARQYHLETGQPARHKVIARVHSYHGSGFGSISISGGPSVRAGFEPYLFPCVQIPPAFCHHCPWSRAYPGCGIACAQEIDAAIRAAGPGTVSCFIAEPVVGRSLGGAPAPAEYFAMAREICDRHGVLLIVDEVVTGFGRLGRQFGIEHWGVTPDLMAIGKGIAGGYTPLAGVLIHGRVADAIRQGSGRGPFGYTYAGNPVSCAAGLAVLDFMQRHALVARGARLGETLLQACAPLRDHPLVSDVRGVGLLVGIEMVADKGARRSFARDRGIAERVSAAAFARGVWVLAGTGGQPDGRGDYLVIAPPLVTGEDDLREGVRAIGEALDAVAEARRY